MSGEDKPRKPEPGEETSSASSSAGPDAPEVEAEIVDEGGAPKPPPRPPENAGATHSEARGETSAEPADSVEEPILSKEDTSGKGGAEKTAPSTGSAGFQFSPGLILFAVFILLSLAVLAIWYSQNRPGAATQAATGAVSDDDEPAAISAPEDMRAADGPDDGNAATSNDASPDDASRAEAPATREPLDPGKISNSGAFDAKDSMDEIDTTSTEDQLPPPPADTGGNESLQQAAKEAARAFAPAGTDEEVESSEDSAPSSSETPSPQAPARASDDVDEGDEGEPIEFRFEEDGAVETDGVDPQAAAEGNGNDNGNDDGNDNGKNNNTSFTENATSATVEPDAPARAGAVLEEAARAVNAAGLETDDAAAISEPAVATDEKKIANELAALKQSHRAETENLQAALAEESARAERQATQIDVLRQSLAEARAAAEAAREASADRESEAVSALRAEVARLEARNAAALSNQQAAAALALVSLQRAVDRGAPYAENLDALSQLTGEAAPLQRLARHAATGAPTLDLLQQEFDAAARAALAAEAKANADGPVDRIAASIGSLVSVRPASPTAGSGTDAVLSRAEAHLDEGDLDAAMRELDALNESAAAAMAPWLEKASTRLEVQQAIDALNARTLSRFETL